jgi:hypothetical protein
MAISNGLWPLNLSVESLVLREMVPNAKAKSQQRDIQLICAGWC